MGNTVMPTDGAAQVWQSIHDSELWQRGALQNGGAQPPERPWLRYGFGAAMAMHGSGLGYGIPDPGGGRLGLNAEGKLEAAFSFEEFGQGITATLEIMLMELFGCGAMTCTSYSVIRTRYRTVAPVQPHAPRRLHT